MLIMLNEKFSHHDIRNSPKLKNEKFVALLTQYLIEIFLAGVYLFLEYNLPSLQKNNWMPIIFGVSTVILPWFWLYPSIGLGF